MAAPTRLIFLDIDGTLVGPTRTPGEAVWRALGALMARDIILCVCTGRPFGGVATEIAQRLTPGAAHIFTAGALLASAQGRVLSAQALPPEPVLKMIAQARRHDLTLELYSATSIAVDRQTTSSLQHAALLGLESTACDLEAFAASNPIIKTQWILREEQAEAILAHPVAGCHMADATSELMPGIRFVSITRAGVDKGSACREVARLHGIDMAHTAGVGDSAGDLPMLEVVGRALVMGNSPEPLRARFETLPCVDDDGITHLLELLS